MTRSANSTKLVKVIMCCGRKLAVSSNVYRAMSMTMSRYKRKRQLHIRNIMNLQNKSVALLHLIKRSSRHRTIWTRIRSGKFFEEDAEKNGEKFFKENFRMNRKCFDTLCGMLRGIAKQDTILRKCIPLQKRVGIALYALGSSAEYRTISNLFGVGKSTICEIMQEFCTEVWRVLRPIYMDSFPLQKNQIEECLKGFGQIGFPQCYGAIDGCHIEIQPKNDEAIDYHNYKGWYSMVLFASVDYRFRFQYISVGSPGRCNDSKIFESSKLKRELQNPILKDYTKKMCGIDVPVLLIGDSAFRLSELVMKPYSFHVDASDKEKTFNYTLSKARRVVENAFGHLKARFRRIGKGLDNKIDKAALVIQCCCVLHNFLNHNNDTIKKNWIQHMQEYERTRRQIPDEINTITESNCTAIAIREAIANYLALKSNIDTQEPLREHDEQVL
ncbi:uncharacterized protein LOC134215122 [Armigeres subalbatus]|uniref:uncharacterized protein LOC134215122 n=1 Tax=Armigeres subalbatus TaxID=124917 RepID=UPI002ED037F4